MDSSIWGPSLWNSLHLITLNYPEKPSYAVRKQYYDFFNNLRYIIPCIYCRKNYIEHLNEIPLEPYLDSRQLLVKWLIDIHNLVNKSLNKSEQHFSNINELYNDLYTRLKSGKNIEKTNYIKFSKIKIIITFLIVIILFFLIRYYYYGNSNLIIEDI